MALPKPHGCINCARFCTLSIERWCSYCATVKNICAACGKSIATNNNIETDMKKQIESIHGQSFHTGGCRSCGTGGRR